jgi:hypothetical protein
MGLRHSLLKTADRIAGLMPGEKPVFYCGNIFTVPAANWWSVYPRYELATARARSTST